MLVVYKKKQKNIWQKIHHPKNRWTILATQIHHPKYIWKTLKKHEETIRTQLNPPTRYVITKHSIEKPNGMHD